MSEYKQIHKDSLNTSESWHSFRKDDLCDIVCGLKSDFKELMLVSITCVDHITDIERFSLLYNFLDIKENRRIFLKILLRDGDAIKSISSIFPNSVWYEREVWDMFGVLFEGNADMRRILTDYGFIGHPLRKDFPLTGYTEVCYQKNTGVMYKKVNLMQDFRLYDNESSWSVLPGDEK